ncbi:MAG: PAC2 family protein [Proteobacteria bacterium]|nr:PAC2 family protein [Pseudomonadota bacterium]
MPTGRIEIFPHEPLRSPVLIQAFAGWNDGGEAASHALATLLETLEAERVAVVETEEFLDFTVVRPSVRMEGDSRRIVWPDHEYFAVRSDAQPFDLVIGLGVEPHLRWRAYCETLEQLLAGLGIEQVTLLGAYLDEVIYSQPVQVMGSSTRPEIQSRLGGEAGRYEGATGIVGVLGQRLEESGLPVLNLWAGLPHYVSRTPNPRAALALLQKFCELSGYRLDLTDLSEQAVAFDREVSEMISNDPQLVAYVRELKKRAFSQ